MQASRIADGCCLEEVGEVIDVKGGDLLEELLLLVAIAILMKKILFLLLMVVSMQVQALAQSNSGKTEALEALGGTGGLLLYDTYLVIGEAADAYSLETYTGEEVIKIVNEQLGGAAAVQEQYRALLATKFLTDPSDRGFLEDLTDAFDLVVAEGKALLQYVESGNNDDALDYDAKRKDAWKEIARLLDFDE